MSAYTHQTEEGQWLVFCVPCSYFPGDEKATDHDTAEHAAALHSSELHLTSSRPEWAEVARWAAEHRTPENREAIAAPVGQ